MAPLTRPPGFFINLFTIGIARARWVTTANAALDHRTSSLFAWLLLPFAHYGLASRLNDALSSVGSRHQESPFWCFLLTGWPLIGASSRMRRGVSRLNDAIRVQQQVKVAVPVD